MRLSIRYQLLLPLLTLSLTVDRAPLDYGEGNPIPGLLLDAKPQGRRFRFHFSIGQAF